MAGSAKLPNISALNHHTIPTTRPTLQPRCHKPSAPVMQSPGCYKTGLDATAWQSSVLPAVSNTKSLVCQCSCDTNAAAALTSSSLAGQPACNQLAEMCVIVDEANNVIGSATRKETVSQRLLGRGSYVLLFNSRNELFVSKRSLSKDCYPGCFDVTISGVVNWGEEYLDTAVRELQEEVSIPSEQSQTLLQHLFIFPYQDEVCHVFGCAFKLTWDGPVAFADAEVEWGRFTPLPELQRQLLDMPGQFTPVGRHILQLYLQWELKHARQ